VKFLFFVMLAALATGCTKPTVPAAEVPYRSGLFMVSAQAQQQPTVVVANNSEANLRMLLNGKDGKALTLDVAPFSEARMDVAPGHYEAKVMDMAGAVRSAFGTADIEEHHTYRTDFHIEHAPGTFQFHIGR
jgi:hypothetical protein